MSFWIFFAKVSICWLGFLVIYVLFLRRETFFQYNRFYLVFSMLAGIFLPLIPIQWVTGDSTVAVIIQPLQEGVVAVESRIMNSGGTEIHQVDPAVLLFIAYLLGVAFFTVRLAAGLLDIYRKFRDGSKTKKAGFTLVYTDGNHLPFSFFSCVFWSKEFVQTNREASEILDHEMGHVRGWHSLDVLLCELACIAFWCNPLVYIYKQSIRLLHEYIADEYVTGHTHRQKYSRLLLKYTQSDLQASLANHFFQSHLKNRLKMMLRNRSRRSNLIKYSMALPVLFLMIAAFAFRKDLGLDSEYVSSQPPVEVLHGDTILFSDTKSGMTIRSSDNPLIVVDGTPRVGRLDLDPNSIDRVEVFSKPNDEILQKYGLQKHSRSLAGQTSGLAVRSLVVIYTKKVSPENGVKIRHRHVEELFKVVEEMPRFPGCEGEGLSKEQRDQCSVERMMKFIYEQIEYPSMAKDNQVQGMVVVRFVVEKDGSLSNIEVVRDLGAGLGEEAKRVVELMNDMSEKWTPGRQRGQTVRVQFNLPVRFKLNNDDIVEESPLKKEVPENISPQEIFKVVEEMPRFPGCEDEDPLIREKCATEKLMRFVFENIQYPAEARENAVQGMVVVRFVVEKDGSITEPQVVRDIGAGCGEEALRVVKSMNENGLNWTPGYQRDRPVRVQFNLPVRFKLPESAEASSTPAGPGEDQIKIQARQLYDRGDHKGAIEKYREGIRKSTDKTRIALYQRAIAEIEAQQPGQMTDKRNNRITGVEAFPNPFTGSLRIRFESGGQETLYVKLLDASGKEVFDDEITKFNGSYDQEVSTSDLPGGTYTLHISQGSTTKTIQLVKH